MSDKAILTIGDQRIELPILAGTEGERAIDITRLRDQTGLITYDPSLGNTGVCTARSPSSTARRASSATAASPSSSSPTKPNFVEVAWLLIFGRLPRQDELERFSGLLTANELLHEGVKHQFQHIPPDAPPMAILSATLSNLACYHQEFFALEDEESLEEAAARLISKVRTIAAFSYRRSLGLPFIYPDPNLRYCANFLHMMFSHPLPAVHRHAGGRGRPEPDLHPPRRPRAELQHLDGAGGGLGAGQPVRLLRGGRLRLWGPLHGGANVEVMEMLERIHQGGLSPEECIRDAKDKTNPFRLYGFGHRDLQELRSAGEDPQGGLRQGVRPTEAARTRCWTSPASSKNWPWPTRISSSGSSIRTSISTAASCCGRSAFPPTCSRSASPSAGCRAGSPSGRRAAATTFLITRLSCLITQNSRQKRDTETLAPNGPIRARRWAMERCLYLPDERQRARETLAASRCGEWP